MYSLHITNSFYLITWLVKNDIWSFELKFKLIGLVNYYGHSFHSYSIFDLVIWNQSKPIFRG